MSSSFQSEVATAPKRRPFHEPLALDANPSFGYFGWLGFTIASMRLAISIALLAIGPAISRISLTGMTPSISIKPLLGFNVKTLARVAGMIKEPQVSVPIATGANPAATAHALPEEDPPGPCLCVRIGKGSLAVYLHCAHRIVPRDSTLLQPRVIVPDLLSRTSHMAS